MLAGPSELTITKGLGPDGAIWNWATVAPTCDPCSQLQVGGPSSKVSLLSPVAGTLDQLQLEAVDHEPNLLLSLSFFSQALVRQLYYWVLLSQRGKDLFWATPKVNGGDDWKDKELGLLPDTQWRCQRILAGHRKELIPSLAELSTCSPLLLPEGASPGFRDWNSNGQLGFLRWTLGWMGAISNGCIQDPYRTHLRPIGQAGPTQLGKDLE